MRRNYLINVYTIRKPLIIAIYEYYSLGVQHQCVKRYLQDNISVATIATVLLLSVGEIAERRENSTCCYILARSHGLEDGV